MTTTFTPARSVGGAATHVISPDVNITCAAPTSHSSSALRHAYTAKFAAIM
jgi:hypothetical protein